MMLHPSNEQSRELGRNPAPSFASDPVPDGQSQSVSLSPSLLAVRGVPSYEMKFQVSEDIARRIEEWADSQLEPDRHADTDLGNAYHIHSLYLDTPALDVYHRTKRYNKRKYRIRRYGNEPGLFLERKTRSGDRVRKRRTPISELDLTTLTAPTTDDTWTAYWFHRSLLMRHLQPVCQVSYERTAYTGTDTDGPIRVTLDRHIRAIPMSSWQVAEPDDSVPVFTDVVVLELKFRLAMPAVFKQLVAELHLNPQPASKYRRSVEACGLDQRSKEAG